MKQFEITLEETKRNFSYDLNKKSVRNYAKLADVKNITVNSIPQMGDIHKNVWGERIILEVKTIDYDSKRCVVINCNGVKWVTKLSNLQFCNKDGSRI